MALKELRLGFRSSMAELEDDILRLGRRVRGSGLTSRLVEIAGNNHGASQWAISMVLVSRQLDRIGDHAIRITGERPPPRSRR